MSDRRYSTARWQRLCKAVLARDGYYCQIGGPCCKVAASTIDHVLPSSTHPELFWEPSNLRAASARDPLADGAVDWE
jgi:5-methylcytosine-specific restriction endonuclease McrA